MPTSIHCLYMPTLMTSCLDSTMDGIELETPVLLVDGYNMCGFWPKLKKYFDRGKLEHARQKLSEELVSFSALRGVKVVVVFDAMLSGQGDHKEKFGCIDVIFAATTCADAWIEKEIRTLSFHEVQICGSTRSDIHTLECQQVASLVADGCPKVWVTTSDRVQQQVAKGCGAFVWICRNLISEINDAKKELRELMRDESVYSTKGKLLEHNLEEDVVLAVQALKQQLRSIENGLAT